MASSPRWVSFTRGNPKISTEHVEEILSVNKARSRPVTGPPTTCSTTCRALSAMPGAAGAASASAKPRSKTRPVAQWDAKDLDTRMIRSSARDPDPCRGAGRAPCCAESFNSEHVDPRVLPAHGGARQRAPIRAMTESTDVDRLTAEPSSKQSNLWYQDGDVVAAGCNTVARQAAIVRALRARRGCDPPTHRDQPSSSAPPPSAGDRGAVGPRHRRGPHLICPSGRGPARAVGEALCATRPPRPAR